ncbi:hypothetical protein WJX81_002203 [Elliptochloris bilobata]|uniref:Cns1/TTC4 wheel domain-containing protein n=1 Tax=Elliptochloris bilobata TaxID=381761 RepID=A0AAW1RJK2_9CHLO
MVTNAATNSAAAPLRNDDLPAAFWDAYPDNPDNPDLQAINALLEEATPEERAETYKNQGNDVLKRGTQLKKKFYLREASGLYTRGLDMRCRDAALVSALFANRAQAQLLLGNQRSALDDALAALRADDRNVKAHYRAARAATALGDFECAAAACDSGLALDPDSPDFRSLRDSAAKQAAARKVSSVTVDVAAEQRAAAEAAAARAPARHLAQVILNRGWRVGLPQLSVGTCKPILDADGQVHWPLMFVYPESMQTDVVEDAAESDTLADHLDAMFAPDAPPLQWDAAGEYTRARLELYYLAHAAAPLGLDELTEALHGCWPAGAADGGPQRYGPRAARWVRVREAATLCEVLAAPDFVAPGLPVFFVVAGGTAYRDRFFASEEFGFG